MVSLLWDSQRPLKAIARQCGDVYIPRGVAVPALDRKRGWEFKPTGLSEFCTTLIPLLQTVFVMSICSLGSDLIVPLIVFCIFKGEDSFTVMFHKTCKALVKRV